MQYVDQADGAAGSASEAHDAMALDLRGIARERRATKPAPRPTSPPRETSTRERRPWRAPPRGMAAAAITCECAAALSPYR
jgi:hypothetical protein